MTAPRVTSPAPRAAWESWAASDPTAVVGQSSRWRDAVVAGGRYDDVSVHYAFPSGREVVLPLVRPRWQPSRAAVVSSWPQSWGVGGPLTSDGTIAPAEAAAVLADAARRGTLAAGITLSHSADPTWLGAAGRFEVEDLGCYVLDLDGGFDEVWQKRFRGTARTAVRKAERSGLEVEVGRSGRLLGVYAYLHELSVRRRSAALGEPLRLSRLRMSRVSSTPRQLALVAAHFGEDCATWVARRDGTPVAAIVVLTSGGYAKYWRGAMDKDLGTPVRANDLLQRLAIEDACKDGYRFYDMGGAHPGSPLAVYKTKLGAELHHTHELRARRTPARLAHTTRLRAEALVKGAMGLDDM